MSTHRPREVDPAAAERLLGGGAVVPADVSDELNRLLAVARAPAQPGELAGEEQVLAVFRRLQGAQVPGPRAARPLRGSGFASLFTMKVAAVSALTVATVSGGVVLAATTCSLPGGPTPGGPATTPKPTYVASETSAGSPFRAEAGAQPSPSQPFPSQSPSPSLFGLCQAFLNSAGDNPGKALESPAFEALIAEAGEKDKVGEYCDGILAGWRGGQPSHPDRPNVPPTVDAPGRPPTVPPGPPGAGPRPAGGKRTG